MNDTDEQRRAYNIQRNAIFLSGLLVVPFTGRYCNRYGNNDTYERYKQLRAYNIQRNANILDETEIPLDEWLNEDTLRNFGEWQDQEPIIEVHETEKWLLDLIISPSHVDISLYILSLLSVKDISKLDIAFCCKQEDKRNEFLEAISNKCCIFDTTSIKWKEDDCADRHDYYALGIGRRNNNYLTWLNKRKININHVYTTTLTFLEQLIIYLKQKSSLKYLEISTGKKGLFANMLYNIANECPQGLKSLILSNNQYKHQRETETHKNTINDVIDMIANKCPDLEVLNLACYTIISIANNPLAPGRAHRYTRGQFIMDTHAQLHDDSVIAIAKKCRGLKLLNVSNNRWITNEAIIKIADNCRGLTSLNVHGCTKISENAIEQIAENCLGLKSLNLNGCYRIGDKAIIKIAEKCFGLESLDLTKCKLITNEAIIKLADNCIGLKSLNLFGCIKITNEAIIKITENCPGLISLNLSPNVDNYSYF